ncbi:hypothetical protein [Actinomadura monticuli]|uniref:Secreted protein n=1 Tax=Actinomadura monticuli TaxID=3097367 RepID=A0ABV4QF70_9ACTN
MLTVRREGHAMSPNTSTGRRTAAAVLATTALAVPLVTAAPSARADGCGVVGERGNCNLIVGTPGTGGGGGGTGGGGTGGPVLPPPPEGLTPDEAPGVVQVPGGPAPQPAPPDTADLLAMARASAPFPKVVVHTAPKDKTYVGLQTSLWVEGFDEVQTQPITIGAQTVQLTAKPKSVIWDLVEKRDFVCTGADAGRKDSKTCNYTFKRSSASQPGGKYMITATISWGVEWTCTGDDCDSDGAVLPDNPISSAPTPLVVGEIQTNTGQ